METAERIAEAADKLFLALLKMDTELKDFELNVNTNLPYPFSIVYPESIAALRPAVDKALSDLGSHGRAEFTKKSS